MAVYSSLSHTLQRPQSAAAVIFSLLAVLLASAHISQKTVCLQSPL